MKTKTKHSRIKITLLDEDGKEVTHEEKIAISEYKSYDDMEDRIIEIEKKAGRFLTDLPNLLRHTKTCHLAHRLAFCASL